MLLRSKHDIRWKRRSYHTQWAANSLIYGGSGNDRIEAVDAGGTIKAGSGDDEILASGEAIYTIYGDRGDDRIIVGTD